MKRVPWLILAAGIVLTLCLSACSTGSSGSGGSGDTGDTGGSGGSISSANDAIANMPELEADLPCSLGGEGENCTSGATSTALGLGTTGLRSMQDVPETETEIVNFALVPNVRSNSWLEFRERAGMPEPYATFVDVLRGLAAGEELVEGSVISVDAFDLPVGGPPGSGGEGEEDGEGTASVASLRPMQDSGGKMRVVSTDSGYTIYWLLPMSFGEGMDSSVYMKWDIVVDADDEWLITAQAQIEMDSIIDPAFTFGAWAQFDTANNTMTIAEQGQDDVGGFTMVSRSYVDDEGNTVFVSSEEFLSEQYQDDYWTVFGWGNDTYGGLANISERTDSRFIYQDFYDSTGSLILEQFGEEWTQDIIGRMFCDLDDTCDQYDDVFGGAPERPEGISLLTVTDEICDFATEVSVSDTEVFAKFYVVESWDSVANELDRRLICGHDIEASGTDEDAFVASTHKSLTSMEFAGFEPTPVSPSDADIDIGFFWEAYYKGYGEDVSATDTWDPGDGRFVSTSWRGPVSVAFTSSSDTWTESWLQEFTVVQRVEPPQTLYSETQYLLNSHYPLKRITPSSVDVWSSCETWSDPDPEYGDSTWCTYYLEAAEEDDTDAGYGELNWATEGGVIADTRLDRVFDWTYYTWDPTTDTESSVTAPFLSTTLPSPTAPFVAPSEVTAILAGMQSAYDAFQEGEVSLDSFLENLTSTTLSEDSNYVGLAD